MFIGNSLTYYNGMPEYLDQMLKATHQRVHIETSTFPGMSLADHLDNVIEAKTENGIRTRKKQPNEQTETEVKILSRKWDVIVLQEGTIRLLIPEARKYSVNTAIEKIKKLNNNLNTAFILFKTWPSKHKYPEQFCYRSSMIDPSIQKPSCCSAKIKDVEEEFALLSAAYDSTAAATQIGKIEVGQKHYKIIGSPQEVMMSGKKPQPRG
ncbi:DUF4886 domain-containing protein [Spirosoma soli]|uniref:DUF4886 domain-containing protein n=1 Tax=Spirosoma soli TaxID=1770529 RepID=A0ABW5ME07_9BACT